MGCSVSAPLHSNGVVVSQVPPVYRSEGRMATQTPAPSPHGSGDTSASSGRTPSSAGARMLTPGVAPLARHRSPLLDAASLLSTLGQPLPAVEDTCEVSPPNLPPPNGWAAPRNSCSTGAEGGDGTDLWNCTNAHGDRIATPMRCLSRDATAHLIAANPTPLAILQTPPQWPVSLSTEASRRQSTTQQCEAPNNALLLLPAVTVVNNVTTSSSTQHTISSGRRSVTFESLVEGEGVRRGRVAAVDNPIDGPPLSHGEGPAALEAASQTIGRMPLKLTLHAVPFRSPNVDGLQDRRASLSGSETSLIGVRPHRHPTQLQWGSARGTGGRPSVSASTGPPSAQTLTLETLNGGAVRDAEDRIASHQLNRVDSFLAGDVGGLPLSPEWVMGPENGFGHIHVVTSHRFLVQQQCADQVEEQPLSMVEEGVGDMPLFFSDNFGDADETSSNAARSRRGVVRTPIPEKDAEDDAK